MKKNRIIRIIAAVLCIVMLLPMTFACGKKEDKADPDNTTENATEPSLAPTDPPTTTEPTTEAPTDPPTTYEPIDPSLPYYEQLDIEFSRFGFTGGDRIVADTEEDTMKKLTANSTKKTELDISAETVPFKFAYNCEVTAESTNFWDKSITMAMMKDKTFTAGDIIAGCFYIRDAGGANPSQVYLAVKTPTDNWATEGAMNVSLITLEPGAGWTKVYFTAEISVDEEKSQVVQFQVFTGYPPHKFEIGGIYINRYPSTKENIRASIDCAGMYY